MIPLSPTTWAYARPGRLTVAAAMIWACLLCLPVAGRANLPKTGNDEIPPLKPPLGEIPPSAWEEHGPAIVTGGALALAGLTAVAWLAFRARPAEPLSPEKQARSQLQDLQGKPQTGQLLSTVSRVTRGYFREAFGLPAVELTTSEFCEQLATHQKISPSLGDRTQAFLRRCDELKFSPDPSPAPFDAAVESLKLVELGEHQLQEAQRRELEKGTPSGKVTGE